MERLVVAAALGFVVAGCAPAQHTPALATVDPRIPTLDASHATCVGRFTFDTEYYRSGQSQCRDGPAGPFVAAAEHAMTAGLVCDYTLTYQKPEDGTGEVACSDGSTGTLTFHRNPQFQGVFAARMKDGRELHFTFSHKPAG